MKRLLYCFIILALSVNISLIIFILINNLNLKKYIYKIEIKKSNKIIDSSQNFSNLDKETETKIELNNNISLPDDNFEFNQNINEKYINEQKYFCNNQKEFYNQKFEKRIRLVDIDLDNIKFNMFVYSIPDYVSNEIFHKKSYEKTETRHIILALNYYSFKKNITKDSIYVVDIGANIGWHSFYLGKIGYKIISFEPSELNYYILKKNYCLNNETNITIINKGLYNEDKKCALYNLILNEGNGMLICDEQKNNSFSFLRKNKKSEIILTKLSHYIPFLSDKNFALIKIDVEGSEGKVIEGGKELITKYHVPFIIMEFTPKFLKLHGTNTSEFLQFFKNNGYNISLNGFFNSVDYSVESLINKRFEITMLYIFYSKFVEEIK